MALICSLAACSGPEAEWAAEAEQYFADIHVSWNSGFANLGTFFAPDAVIDTHTLTGRPLAVGRAAGVADPAGELPGRGCRGPRRRTALPVC